jgi:hypothetical protein
MHKFQFTVTQVAVSATILTLTACGGGSSTDAPTTPTKVTVSGKVVINQAVSGAVVCMDVNGNAICDSTEPTSAPTPSDGVFTISMAATDAATLAGSRLLAQIPPTARDAAAPNAAIATTTLQLSAPTGKSNQINPLTTLVQSGVASGLTLAKSEAAVAVQLKVSGTEIYDYQNSTVSTGEVLDNARSMANAVLLALTKGAALKVAALESTEDPIKQLQSLRFTNSANYGYTDYTSTVIPNTGKSQVVDIRRGMTAGVPTPESNLYTNVYLTPTGWLRCDASGFLGTRGTPSRSEFCGGGQLSVGTAVLTDISGKSMATVVSTMQSELGGASSLNLDPALLGNQTFPAGSGLYSRTTTNLGRPTYISNINSTSEVNIGNGAKTLEDYIANRRSATLNLTTGAGMAWVGYTADASHWLMVSFADATSRVQYYSCTFNASNLVTGCVALNSGTFSIGTVQGVRLMEFQSAPSYDLQTYSVGFVEYNGGVARVNRTLTGNRESQRLNGVAAEALKKALGI